MKKILYIGVILMLLLSSFSVYSQARTSIFFHEIGKLYYINDLVSVNGTVYKCVVQTTTTPPSPDWVTSPGDVSLLETRRARVRTEPAGYTTDSLDTGMKIDITGGGITLDDTNVLIGNQFSFFNNTGAPIPWVFGNSSKSIEGVLNDLPDKKHAYVRLIAAGEWTVINGFANNIYAENTIIGDTISAGEVVYLLSGKWEKAVQLFYFPDPTYINLITDNSFVGLLMEDALPDDTGKQVLLQGVVSNYATWSLYPSKIMVREDNRLDQGSTAYITGNKIVYLGRTLSSVDLFFDGLNRVEIIYSSMPEGKTFAKTATGSIAGIGNILPTSFTGANFYSEIGKQFKILNSIQTLFPGGISDAFLLMESTSNITLGNDSWNVGTEIIFYNNSGVTKTISAEAGIVFDFVGGSSLVIEDKGLYKYTNIGLNRWLVEDKTGSFTQNLDSYETKRARPLSSAVNYTTVTADVGKKIDMTGGNTITLDDTDVVIGDQFSFYNNTGTPIAWAFGGGNSAIEGVLGDLPDMKHGYARLVSAGIWTVIDGASGGGNQDLSPYEFKDNRYIFPTGDYTTIDADRGKKVFSTGSSIILDDTGLTIGFQQSFFNESGGDIVWNFAAGNSALQGTLNNLPNLKYGYAELKVAGIWSIIDGSASGGGGAVDSVNGQTGVVILNATDVNALPEDINTITVSNYTTTLADRGAYITVSAGNVTLDKTGLPDGFHQIVFNNSGGDINLVGDTVIGSNNVIPDGLYATYVLNGTTWQVSTPSSGGGATNLDYIPSTTNGVITSDTGTDATIPLVGANAGLSSPADKVKIDASIGGSISDTHIGVGDINGDIVGSSDLTWDGSTFDITGSLKVNHPTSSNVASLETNPENNYVRATFKLGSDNMINSRLWIVPDVPSGTYVSNGLEILNSEDTSQTLTKRFGFTISETKALIQSTSMVGTSNGAAIDFTTLGTLVSQMTLEKTGQLTLPANPTIDTHVGNRGYNDGRYITDIVVQGFNNPISTVTVGTGKGLSYSRAVPIIVGDTPRTIADNFTGVLFTNDQATPLTITIPDTFSDISGWQFSAAKFGTGDVILDPTGTTTINGSTATITITTQYTGVVQLFYMGNADWHLIGKL